MVPGVAMQGTDLLPAPSRTEAGGWGWLMALLEQLRRDELAGPVVDPAATQAGCSLEAGAWLNGPKLILVSGAGRQAIYPLQSASVASGSWLIGRGNDVDVLLSDPYVSRRGTEVWQEGDAFFIEDRGPSRNGTYLNWRRLSAHEAASLQDGDIVGVGRSLLVFRSA